ncbi:MAG: DHH family phosphoesterase [Butyricicoccus pullicaecorum]|nr:DHH family phosphoesterase [Butyricicoccus pullicaecorum]
MDKRLKKLLEPSYQVYFMVFLLFSVACAYISVAIAIIGIALDGFLFLAYHYRERTRRRDIIRYMQTVTLSVGDAAQASITHFPMPAVIVQAATGEIIWTNDAFAESTGCFDSALSENLMDLAPDFDTHWLVEGKAQYPGEVRIGKNVFWAFGNLLSADKNRPEEVLMLIYFVPCTELIEMRDAYSRSRPVVAIISIDNYEELIKEATDLEKSSMMADINRKIGEWTQDSQALLRKYDRDKYIFVLEEAQFEKLQEKKFSVLQDVRSIQSRSGIVATLSIGIGKDGESYEENWRNASVALDMALSRGGDQAVIKTRYNFDFFGGLSKELEKRTKVKSRVLANALVQLIRDSSQVMIMGHKMSDMDAFGAAVGMACAVRHREKPVHIVINQDKTMAQNLIEKIKAVPEYEDLLMSPDEAMVQCDFNTLLIVVDTNRPDYVESLPLLESINKVAVIDHHRRAASYIENFALNLHEPYASSTCELVSEMLQYMVPTSDILKAEAECMLAGLYLDTKGFSVKTGVRTFEAAAYLKRAGADMGEVMKLFQSNFDEYIAQQRIIAGAADCGEGIVLAVTEEEVDRVTAAKAADSLLKINGVNASVVVFRAGDDVLVSARSNGTVNVQLLMEQLGGGGNHSSAGAQIMHGSVREVKADAENAIRRYQENEDGDN